MKSDDTAAILNQMINRDVVRFVDETEGITFSIERQQVLDGMFILAIKNKEGTHIASMYFNSYETVGADALRLCWNECIVGTLYTPHIKVAEVPMGINI